MFLTKVEISRDSCQTNSNTSDMQYQFSPNEGTCYDHSKSTDSLRFATIKASQSIVCDLLRVKQVGRLLATCHNTGKSADGLRLATIHASQPPIGDRLATPIASQPPVGDRLATPIASPPPVGDRLATPIASQSTVSDLQRPKQVCRLSITCNDQNKSADCRRKIFTMQKNIYSMIK
jgi:hypothetical protein